MAPVGVAADGIHAHVCTQFKKIMVHPPAGSLAVTPATKSTRERRAGGTMGEAPFRVSWRCYPRRVRLSRKIRTSASCHVPRLHVGVWHPRGERESTRHSERKKEIVQRGREKELNATHEEFQELELAASVLTPTFSAPVPDHRITEIHNHTHTCRKSDVSICRRQLYHPAMSS